MIEGNFGNCGNWDMRKHSFKMMLHSIQYLAGPLKIRPEDGLPASCNKKYYEMTWDQLTVHYINTITLGKNEYFW
jgi:hypothetical protein